ncbi:MAG: alpha/beta hydrolase [Lachnospiraceae bacterium]|nr:alpha/beta hydrolase [Lachnospiraceae bacterium]
MASTEMENLKVGMQMMMKQGFAPKFDGEMDPLHLRKVVQDAQERMPAEPGVSFVPITFGGVTGEINSKEGNEKDYIIIYIHGGGLICGNAYSSRGYASMLTAETGRDVYTLDYRLCPENPYPAPVDDCVAFYKGVCEEYQDTPIYLIGESGGAYLSIAVTIRLREEGYRLPAGIVPYSAPIDFRANGEQINREFEGNKDFTVTPNGLTTLGKLFDPTLEYSEDPVAHPILDDFHGFPPVLLAWDESESLAVDQNIIVEKLQKVGGSVTYKSYPDCFHAFATAGRGTEESRDILKDTIAFFEKNK